MDVKDDKQDDNRQFKKAHWTSRYMEGSRHWAPLIVGIGLVAMFCIAILVEMLVFSSLLVNGEPETTINNIRGNLLLFWLGMLGYLIILVLDVLIAWGLYMILKPVNVRLSKFCATLRILYVVGMAVGLIGLALLNPEIYTYGELIAYAFFTGHIFILGYLTLKSEQINRFFGIFLVAAGFGFIILTYGEYLIKEPLIGILMIIAMVPGAFAEVSLGVYLMVKEIRRSKKEKKEIMRNETLVSIVS